MTETNFFGNRFDNVHITNERLVTYMREEISLLTADNTGGQWTATITMLTTAVSALEAEISDVDTSKNVQVGATDAAQALINEFHTKMSDEFGVIAKLLGGKESAGMLEFYPQGLTGYNKIKVEQMATFTTRVAKAAEKYRTQLGDTLADELEAFEALWLAARNSQVDDMSNTTIQRTERNTARQNANIASHKAAHRVADIYAQNEDKAESLCPFHLLYADTHRTAHLFNGTLAPGAHVAAFNKIFFADSKYHFASLSDNASFEAWMTTTPDGLKGDKFITVNASEGLNTLREKLGGDEKTPYLIIKNTSPTNEVEWRVEVK